MKVTYNCNECCTVFLTLDSNYVANNPNASDIYIEQIRNKHLQSCASVKDEDYTCPDCGDVYASVNPAYVSENQNGSGIWINQEYINHLKFCKGDFDTQKWVYEINKKFRNRTLTKSEFKEAYSAHRDHAWGRGDGAHFGCFHYMLSV